MARSAEAARRIRARQKKRERSSPEGFDFSWQKWLKCDLCEKAYCANNYSDRKIRIVRWKRYALCAHCRYTVLPAIKKLIAQGVLKERKQKKHGKV